MSHFIVFQLRIQTNVNSVELDKTRVLYTHQNSLATLDDEIVDPEITVKLEMRDVLKVHDAQT